MTKKYLTKSLFNTYCDSVKKNNSLAMVKYQIMFRRYTKSILMKDDQLDEIRENIIKQQKKIEQQLNENPQEP